MNPQFLLDAKLYRLVSKKLLCSDVLTEVDKTYGVMSIKTGALIQKSISNVLRETADSTLQYLDTNGKNLKDFFTNFDLVFHNSVNTSGTQDLRRVDFAAHLYEQYFVKKFHKITVRQSCPEINTTMGKKAMYTKEKLSKYPILVSAYIRPWGDKDPVSAIDYLIENFGDQDFSVDQHSRMKTYYSNDPMVVVAFSNKMQFNIFNLSMPGTMVVDKKVDFSEFLEEMAEVEHIIETKFLK